MAQLKSSLQNVLFLQYSANRSLTLIDSQTEG